MRDNATYKHVGDGWEVWFDGQLVQGGFGTKKAAKRWVSENQDIFARRHT
jgi:hypothetical protein